MKQEQRDNEKIMSEIIWETITGKFQEEKEKKIKKLSMIYELGCYCFEVLQFYLVWGFFLFLRTLLVTGGMD